jgi:hypothetical protein
VSIRATESRRGAPLPSPPDSGTASSGEASHVIALVPGWTLDGHPVIAIELDATHDDPAGTFIVIAGNRVKRMRNDAHQDVR